MYNMSIRMIRTTMMSLALLTLFPVTTHASSRPIKEVGYYIESSDQALLHALFERFDMEERLGQGYVVVVRENEKDKLLALAPSARPIDLSYKSRELRHDVDSVTQELNQLAQQYPGRATTESYGSSVENRPLTAIRITSPTLADQAKPEIMITSATHGDEGDTVELTMSIINKLVTGYGSDARVTGLLDKHTLYFIPVVSPDGYAYHSRYANGVDPNRNYPYPDEPNRTPNAALANEIAWVAKHNFKGSIDIHENLSTVMYPWAYTNERPSAADIPTFEAITKQLANVTGYNHGQISDVFGIAQGSSADYWYWKHKTTALGYEMSGDSPDRDTEAVFQFIEHF